MPTSGNKSKRTKVFVSYSHKDREAGEAIDRIEVHLKPLVRGGLDLWVDTRIKEGDRWRDTIKTALDEAKVAILLISADFLASEFIHGNELPPILKAAEKEGLIILQVILSSVDLCDSPLREIQAFNTSSTALSGLSYNKKETIWMDLKIRVREIFSEFSDNEISTYPSETKVLKSYTEQLGAGVDLEMMAIPGGSFWMWSRNIKKYMFDDSEIPHYPVNISPFLIGRFPVTQRQWMKVATYPKIKVDIKPKPVESHDKNRPVECISWQEAVEFCGRLSQRTDKYYRLPSESEWEYACRGGKTTPYHFDQRNSSELSNLGRGFDRTIEVGNFDSNEFGLFDMHSNLWEWCADHWNEDYSGKPSDRRVLRGGSWQTYFVNARYSGRRYIFIPDFRNVPDNGDNSIGFRVVCSSA